MEDERKGGGKEKSMLLVKLKNVDLYHKNVILRWFQALNKVYFVTFLVKNCGNDKLWPITWLCKNKNTKFTFISSINYCISPHMGSQDVVYSMRLRLVILVWVEQPRSLGENTHISHPYWNWRGQATMKNHLLLARVRLVKYEKMARKRFNCNGSHVHMHVSSFCASLWLDWIYTEFLNIGIERHHKNVSKIFLNLLLPLKNMVHTFTCSSGWILMTLVIQIPSSQCSFSI